MFFVPTANLSNSWLLTISVTLKTSFRNPVGQSPLYFPFTNLRVPFLVFYLLSCSLDKYFICTQVLTDRSPLLTQIFSTDCRDALGQMLEAQVLYLHPLIFNCVVPDT